MNISSSTLLPRTLASFLYVLLAALPLSGRAQGPAQVQTPLAGLSLQAASVQSRLSFDGVVEASRQTVLAAQVAGAIVRIEVKVGDQVKAGQLLLSVDARAAVQAASASEAQGQATRAALQLATREFDRQQQLFKQQYISRAALEQAESQFKATQAQLNAQLANLGIAQTQAGLHKLYSPYDAIVAELPVAMGDMALPGRPLLTLYDPSALRVTATVPQSLAASLQDSAALTLEVAGLSPNQIRPQRVQVLPVADATSQTLQLRLDLPPGLLGLRPGMFARLWISGSALPGAAAQQLLLPSSAVVRRAELQAVYVLDSAGRALLRQVRLGAVRGAQVEVLSGLSVGERIATDPAAAARQSSQGQR